MEYKILNSIPPSVRSALIEEVKHILQFEKELEKKAKKKVKLRGVIRVR